MRPDIASKYCETKIQNDNLSFFFPGLYFVEESRTDCMSIKLVT